MKKYWKWSLGVLSIVLTLIVVACSEASQLPEGETPLQEAEEVSLEPAALCSEFVSAIAWSNKSTGKELFPVVVYFTKHFGYGGTYTATKDSVFYASDAVKAVNTPTPHLKGTLKVAKNSDNVGEMVETSTLTYDVEVFPNGTLKYLMKINGNPVGGAPATSVQATCVNNVLLTAINGSEVVTVGVARKPSEGIPF